MYYTVTINELSNHINYNNNKNTTTTKTQQQQQNTTTTIPQLRVRLFFNQTLYIEFQSWGIILVPNI